MTLPLKTDYAPMEALPAAELPAGRNGSMSRSGMAFAVSRFRDGAHIDLQSKSGKPLTRYFPELVEALLASSRPLNLFWMGKS